MLTRRSLLQLSSALALAFGAPAFASVTPTTDDAQAVLATTKLSIPGVWPVQFTDCAGRQVQLSRAPKRIIVGNYLANFLLTGGASALQHVVGLTLDHWQDTRQGEYAVFTKAFPDLLKLPSVGGYHDDILNTERILSLKPEVLLIGKTQFEANNARIALLERAGIRVIVLDYHAMTLENHIRSTRILGRLLECDDVAEALVSAAANGLAEIDRRIATLPEAQRNTPCYMELGSLGPAQQGNTYNGTVLWGAILRRIGAASIADGRREPWGPLTREFVVAKRPEVIIIGGSLWGNNHGDQMTMGFTVPRDLARTRLTAFRDRALWKNLPAIKNNRIYAVDHGSLRTIVDWHFTAFLAKVFYPETFADMDPEKSFLDAWRERLPEVDPQGTFMLNL